VVRKVNLTANQHREKLVIRREYRERKRRASPETSTGSSEPPKYPKTCATAGVGQGLYRSVGVFG